MSSVTVEINGRETVSEAARNAKKGLTDLGSSSQSVASQLAAFAAIAATVSAAVLAIARASAECVKEYATWQREQVQFNAAMKLSGSITREGGESLRKYAEEMATLTGADDGAILSMEAFLASAGRNEQQIKQLIQVAADYSTATGKDMRTAVEELNKTYSGSEGRIGQLIPALKDLTDEELKAGKGIDIVGEQYKGFAAQLANTTDVELKNFKNAFSDLKAALGHSAVQVYEPFLTYLTNLANKWATAAEYKAAYYDIKDASEDVSVIEAKGNLDRVQAQLQLAYLAQRQARTVPSDKEANEKADKLVTKLQDELEKWRFAYEKATGRWKEVFDVKSTAAKNLVSDGDDEATKQAKANYKAVEKLYQEMAQWIKRDTLHPYGTDESKNFWATAQEGYFDIDALDLGPDATKLKVKIKEMLDTALESPNLYAFDPSNFQVVTSANFASSLSVAEPAPFQGAFSASDLARVWRDPAAAYAFDPLAMEFGDVSATFRDDLSVALEPVIDAVTGGLGYRGQSSIVPETLGAGGASIFDQVWAQLLDDLQAEFTTPQQRLAPEGYAPRDDFLDQIWPQILADLQGEFTTPQQRQAPAGMEPRDDFMDQVWGPILADLQNEFTTPQQRQAPEGYAPRDDFRQQLGLADDLRPGARAFANNGNGAVEQEAPTWLEELGNFLMPVAAGFMGLIMPLSSVQEILNPLQTVLSGMMDMLGPLINTVLAPIVGILRVIGTTLGQMLAPIISALGPIINALALGFVWLYNNAIVPFANAVIIAGNWLYNGIVQVVNFLLGWLGVHMDTVALNNGALSTIDLASLSATGGTSYSGTTGSSATYEKQRDITNNFYLNVGQMVGDGGFHDFVMMITREQKAAGVLGVA